MKKSIKAIMVLGFAIFFCEQGVAQGQAPWVGETFDGVACNGKGQGVGPHDYIRRGNLMQQLKLVENFHFTPEVEQLVRGKSGRLEGDLDYTLRAWPNHHRALNAMIRYQLDMSRSELLALRNQDIPPVECYLQRAVNFSPGDDMAFMLYGLFSHRKGRQEEAHDAYRKAVELAPGNLQAKYNFALLLLDMGQISEAEKFAEEIYSTGFPLQGLKRKLAKSKQDTPA